MSLRHLDWSYQVLLAALVTVSCGATAFAQNVPPAAPAVDGGESAPIVAEPATDSATCGINQSGQSCQPWNGGGCPTCQPTRCSRWARCKAKQQAKWWGYPEEFEELPFGCLTNALIEQPIQRGHQARMALYHYDFVNGTEQLNAAGRRRVARLAAMSQSGWGPLVVEESADTELDQHRRAAVLRELSLVCPGVTGDSVVVGFPIATGLNGVEGRSINRGLMNQTGTRGVGAVSNSSGLSSAGSFSPSSTGSSSGSGGGGGGGSGSR